jgi:TatD DNase family protein
MQFDQYDADRDELIARMKEGGVGGIVVGTEYETSKKAIELAEKHEYLFASVGLHPNHCRDEWFEYEKYHELTKHPKVVAIGECGLDYFRPEDVTPELINEQKRVLKDHFKVAGETGKPLIIHSRPSKGTQDAYQDLIALLIEVKQKYPNLRGDIHFFVGGMEEMRALTALGFTVSFTAVITFAREYDAVVQEAPLTSILSETDAPYVAPKSRRGQRNDPLAIPEIVAKIAEIRGEDPEIVRKTLLQNAQNLFIF